MSITGMHMNEPHYTFILDKDHTNLLQIKPPKGEVLKIEKANIKADVTTDEGVKAVTEHIKNEVAKLQKQKEEKEKELEEAKKKKDVLEEAPKEEAKKKMIRKKRIKKKMIKKKMIRKKRKEKNKKCQ